MTISFWSKGGFDFYSLKELPFDEFEQVLKEALRIQELSRKGGTDG